MSEMKEGEVGVLIRDEGEVYSLTNTLNSDEVLFGLIEEYLNKQNCTLVQIHGTEEIR